MRPTVPRTIETSATPVHWGRLEENCRRSEQVVDHRSARMDSMTDEATPGPFLVRPTLEGERCILRPFTLDDIEAMGEILADPDVNRLTGSARSTVEAENRPRELDDRTRRWYETRNQQTNRLDLAVIDLAGGRCVGEAVLNDWRPADDIVGFRILLGPVGRDRGLGSEATGLITDYCFRSTTINRIELEVYAFNPRAQRVYEKAGFVVEGRRRQVLKFDGAYMDVIQMSILRSDWQARQAPVGLGRQHLLATCDLDTL